MNFDDLGEEQLLQIQQLLGSAFPETQENFQAQAPQFAQGLLGSTDDQQQAQNLQQVISGATEAANQMAKVAQAAPSGNNLLAQRQAANQQATSGALLGKIASLFIPSGSLLGFLKKKI